MKTLAGTLIEINFIDMMLEIVKIVLVPIGAALLHDFLKRATASQRKKVNIVFVLSIIWILLIVFLLQKSITDASLLKSINLSGFFAGAIIAGTVYHFYGHDFQNWIASCRSFL
jgi:BASS family bile acid:Na+ symporter